VTNLSVLPLRYASPIFINLKYLHNRLRINVHVYAPCMCIKTILLLLYYVPNCIGCCSMICLMRISTATMGRIYRKGRFQAWNERMRVDE